MRLRLILGAVLAVTACSGEAIATQAVSDGDITVFTGDSTSDPAGPFDWYTNTFVPGVNAQFHPTVKLVDGKGTGSAGVCTGTAGKPGTGALAGSISVIGDGISGSVAATIATNAPTLIVANHPASLFLAVGTNDIAFGTDPSAFRASYDSILSQALAGTPVPKIWCMSIYARFEAWTTGPAWNNADDANVATFNSQIAASCAAAGGVYVDTRTPLLTWEVTNNPAKDPSGHALQSDGIHLQTTGKIQIGTAALAAVSVTP